MKTLIGESERAAEDFLAGITICGLLLLLCLVGLGFDVYRDSPWSNIGVQLFYIAFIGLLMVASIWGFRSTKRETRILRHKLNHIVGSRDVPNLPVAHVGYEMPREERLEIWLQYYLRNLCEDGQDGSKMDCQIIAFVRDMQLRYAECDMTDSMRVQEDV